MKNSGIYIILNLITLDYYLGSSNNISKRLNAHKRELRLNKHHSTYLQRVFNKYGLENLDFKVFLNCEQSDLLILEQFCIDFLKPRYNISKNAISPMKNRKHSLKTKRKMSKIHKGNKYNLGKKHSLKSRKIRSEKRKQFRWSDGVKQKMSKTARRINSISRIDRNNIRKKIQDNLGNQFNSLTEASKFHNIHKSTICDILRGRHIQTRMGVSFGYI